MKISFLINKHFKKSEGHILIFTLIVLCAVSFIVSGICACVNAQYLSVKKEKSEFYSYVEKRNADVVGNIQ